MTYSFQGKGYASLLSCYEDHKEKATVTIETVQKRLNKGWSLGEALLQPPEKTLNTKLGEHTVEGIVYANLPSIAEEYGMSLNTVYKRYSRGYRSDDLVPLKKRKTYSPPEVEILYRFFAGGVGYKSAADACRKLDIKYGTYRKKIEKGFTIEQALAIDSVEDGRALRGNKHDVDGALRSVQELSELYGVNEMTIRSRLKRGATIRQAIGLEDISDGSLLKESEVVRKKRATIRLEVEGEIFKSYKALADRYGLPQYTVRQRIVDYGYTPEEAVKLDGKSKPITVEGIDYSSKTALAEAYGLTSSVLLARLAGDTTIEEALGIDQKETSRSITFEGENYRSLKDFANKKGITTGILRARISSGLSLKEALEASSAIKNAGRYNLTILERDRELANKSAWLYFVRIFIDERELFKIGITTQTVAHRLNQEAYRFVIIKVVKGTLIDCFTLEQEIIGSLSDKRDINVTSDMLDGYSEVFNLNDRDVEVISNILDEQR